MQREPLDFLMMAWAVALMAPYLCRLGLLFVRDHDIAIGLFHATSFCAVIVSGFAGYDGATDWVHVFATSAATLWIIVSRESWSKGQVPAHYLRKRQVVLEPEDNLVSIEIGRAKGKRHG